MGYLVKGCWFKTISYSMCVCWIIVQVTIFVAVVALDARRQLVCSELLL